MQSTSDTSLHPKLTIPTFNPKRRLISQNFHDTNDKSFLQLLSTCIKIIIIDYIFKVETKPGRNILEQDIIQWRSHGEIWGTYPLVLLMIDFLTRPNSKRKFWGRIGTNSNIKFFQVQIIFLFIKLSSRSILHAFIVKYGIINSLE